MKADRGFSLIELGVGMGLASVLIYIATQFIQASNQAQEGIAASGASVLNLTIPIFTLKKDIRGATSLTQVTMPDPTIMITVDGLDAGLNKVQKQITYTILTEPCPEFGSGAQCKTLVRSDASTTQSFKGLADLDWCLWDNSLAIPTPFSDCTSLPFANSAPAPKNAKRFALLFSRYSANKGQSKINQPVIIDLENVPITAADAGLKVLRKM